MIRNLFYTYIVGLSGFLWAALGWLVLPFGRLRDRFASLWSSKVILGLAYLLRHEKVQGGPNNTGMHTETWLYEYIVACVYATICWYSRCTLVWLIISMNLLLHYSDTTHATLDRMRDMTTSFYIWVRLWQSLIDTIILHPISSLLQAHPWNTTQHLTTKTNTTIKRCKLEDEHKICVITYKVTRQHSTIGSDTTNNASALGVR